MPDKPLTVLTYAASASLAAVALVYFFNPNHLIDGEALGASASARKKGVVGLSNPMNDCFINSVLQSLAGLRELRLYLIRELHRRKRGGEEIFRALPDKKEGEKPADARKLLSLQSGEVTQGLKEIIDRLNERPLYRKTISAEAFTRVLEHAYETRISKAQQDAQELLQVIAERLCDEYHAAKDARKRAMKAMEERTAASLGMNTQVDRLFVEEEEEEEKGSSEADAPGATGIEKAETAVAIEEESGFPLEGRTESQIECQHCHFIPKPNPVPFVILTLSVPQKSSTTLDECFDIHFKTEMIDDYKCDRCRLEHAVDVFTKDLAQARSEVQKSSIRAKISAVEQSLANDPEKPPSGLQLPDSKLAPARRIARHVSLTSFPRVLVIHLSRSIFDSSSAKNMARVSFPERLVIGGLVNRHRYKLLGVVTHKGTHNSGHYESFRRQHIYAPSSTPYSPAATEDNRPKPTPSPQNLAAPAPPGAEVARKPVPSDLVVPADPTSAPTTPSSSPSLLASERSSSASTRPSTASLPSKHGSLRSPLGSDIMTPTTSSSHAASPALSTPSHLRTATPPTTSPPVFEDTPARRDSLTTQRAFGLVDSVRPRSRRKKDGTSGEPPDAGRWWRISDDKVRECRTADVLGMQKEVYLLFYEMEPHQHGSKAG